MLTVADDSIHYLPAADVLVCPAFTTSRIAYGQLSAAKAGGLVVVDGQVPLHYLTGRFLMAAIRSLAVQTGVASAALMPVIAYVSRFLNSSDPLHRAITESLGGAIAVVPVDPEPLPDWVESEEVSREGLRVFEVINREQQRRGWYFNHEPLQETVHTPSAQWYCDLNNHPNADPDNGKCRLCPGRLN